MILALQEASVMMVRGIQIMWQHAGEKLYYSCHVCPCNEAFALHDMWQCSCFRYRAPELLLGEGKYGPEVDIWAVGGLQIMLESLIKTYVHNWHSLTMTSMQHCF